ncbi:MAG: nucleotidyltransferase family protein [Lachnospiraceae bacterium]
MTGIVSSIIRQDARKVPFSRLDWERMYRIADYHKVANIVHLCILGNRDSVPDKWRERFFERYQEALQYGENYNESVRELLTWLDTRKMSCTILMSETVRDYYPIPETADNSPLQLLLNTENFTLVKGYLIDLGYETVQTYEGVGERLERSGGIAVVLYYRLPFRTARYESEMRRLLETAILRESYQYIRTFSVEGELIYRLASAAYRYVADELTMREVLDLQLCHRVWREHIRPDAVERRLKDLQVDELAEKLLRISYMWFGDRKDTFYEHLPDDMPAYDRLEERLLTRGIVNQETDEQALKLCREIKKEQDKEKRAEERRQFFRKMGEHWEKTKRGIRWAFPDYHYMSSIYPKVERFPVLLPVFWIIRGVRLLRRVFMG